MKISLALSILLVSATPAAAQEFSKTYLECMARTSGGTIENKRCASAELTKAERELDARYSRALAAVADTPEAVPKIKAAKAAWEAFVDAYIEAIFPLENKQAEYGTSYGEAVSIWRIKLAWTQFAILDELHAPPQYLK
jgi:uncharacterized protein YecT (DUF1311 family)